MQDEKIVLCNIVNSEVETLKDTFALAINQFYDKYDCRLSLRREKIIKYICILSNLIEDTKQKVLEVMNE